MADCTNPIATFFVSVNVHRSHQESSAVSGVHDVLRCHQVPALWSFEFAETNLAAARLAKGKYEFGILAAPTWANAHANRNTFGRELQSRLERANAMGIQPLVLTVSENDPPAHFDLLVKHHIALVNTMAAKSRASGPLVPRLSRYGIWQTHPSLIVPGNSNWTLVWTARRLLRQAIRRGVTLHVAVDTERLCNHVASGLGTLERLLKLAESYRAAGSLRFVSTTELLETYAPRRHQMTSRSILKAA